MNLNDLKQFIQNEQILAFDIETDSLNPRASQIIGFSVANLKNESHYVILKAFQNGELVDVVSKEEAAELISLLVGKKLVGWNLSFDTRHVYHYFNINLIPSVYFDGMLALHTLDEDRFSYSLKDYGAEVFGKSAKDAQDKLKESMEANGASKGELYKADANILAEYGKQDALLTIKLYKHLHSALEKADLLNFFLNTEVMPFYRHTLINMELKGIPVDVPYLQQSLAEIKKDLESIENSIIEQISPHLDLFTDWFLNKDYPVKMSGPFLQKALQRLNAPLPVTKTGAYSLTAKNIEAMDKNHNAYKLITGSVRLTNTEIRNIQLDLWAETGTKHMFNILSKHHLKKLFFDTLGESPLSRTEKGAPQVDEDFLELMGKKYKWAEELIVYNKLTKINGTYIERILEEQENGIFYPQFFMHRTTSGRLSGDAQQLPRIKGADEVPSELVRKYNNRIRNFFISKPGWKLIDADYTSLEVMVFADDSQDPALINIIKNNLDLYSQVAINAWNLHEFSADKKAPNFLKNHRPEKRQAAKAFALGFRYGLGTYKLSKDLCISESEAKAIYNNYFGAFPQLKKRMDEVIQSARSTGMVKSKAGRIRHLPELKQLVDQYGTMIFDQLEIWKEYNDMPGLYESMKKKCRLANNLQNNALNFPIQSLAASIVAQSAVQISKELQNRQMEAYICLSVHDELCIHAPEHEVEAVCELMQRHMEQTLPLSVPLEAEPIVGTKYGEIK